MVKCSYSGEEIPPGKGLMYVKKDGKVMYFLNSKCRRYFLLGRKPRDVAWTAEGRKAKEERLRELKK